MDAAPATAPALGLTPTELLTTTRSVRRRLDLKRPVSRELVLECLAEAFQAPNGDNAQPYVWIVVDDPQQRAAMAEVYRDCAAAQFAETEAATSGGPPSQLERLGLHLDLGSPNVQRIVSSAVHLQNNIQHVPILVVPVLTMRLESATLFEASSMWGSILPAAWSFMLALRSRGLGSAWTTIHLRDERRMADILGIPHDRNTQVGLFPVAYTIGTDFKQGRRRVDDSVVRWNHWA